MYKAREYMYVYCIKMKNFDLKINKIEVNKDEDIHK